MEQNERNCITYYSARKYSKPDERGTMAKGMMIMGGIAILLAGAWTTADATNCHSGTGGGPHGMTHEWCWNTDAGHFEGCHGYHIGYPGLGMYDLSDEDRARIESIMEEAMAEIDAILEGYEPVSTGHMDHAAGCGCCH